MVKRILWALTSAGVFSLAFTAPASAAMAVVDVRAIAQMAQQMRVLQDQLSTARNHLTQAQQLYQSVTGGRGMERLLSGIQRNYLPADWNALSSTLQGLSSTYSSLASQINGTAEQNAVLTREQLAALSETARRGVERERRIAATEQVMTREALSNTSQRFQSVQQLIDAIPRATDEKAVLDLQARIAAEQAMLQNEQTKLQLLQHTLEAERAAHDQQLREQAIADIGSFKNLPPLNLPR